MHRYSVWPNKQPHRGGDMHAATDRAPTPHSSPVRRTRISNPLSGIRKHRKPLKTQASHDSNPQITPCLRRIPTCVRPSSTSSHSSAPVNLTPASNRQMTRLETLSTHSKRTAGMVSNRQNFRKSATDKKNLRSAIGLPFRASNIR
jgi:hypothetical protein